MRARLATVAALVALSGCRTGPAPEPGDGRPTKLAKRAVALAETPRASAVGTPRTTAAASPRAGGARPIATPRRTFRRIGSASDARGDAGIDAPAYADVRAVTIEDDGTSARVSVEFAATLPNPMPSGEQMGVGVDLFRRAGQRESESQVFASGTEDGWLAYLDTPRGFVAYPGAFHVGASRLVFTVPWSALGQMRGAAFSAFVDWDRDRPLLDEVGEDHVPDEGTAPFAR